VVDRLRLMLMRRCNPDRAIHGSCNFGNKTWLQYILENIWLIVSVVYLRHRLVNAATIVDDLLYRDAIAATVQRKPRKVWNARSVRLYAVDELHIGGRATIDVLGAVVSDERRQVFCRAIKKLLLIHCVDRIDELLDESIKNLVSLFRLTLF